MCAEFAGCCGVNGLGKLYRLTRGFIVGRDTVGLFTDHDSEGFDWEFEVEGRNERVGRK